MSLVGFRAQNHPQQDAKDWVDDRSVLPEFFEPLHAQYRFTVDAAASVENALLPRFWTKADDALRQLWSGERVWCNPPFSNLEPWLHKAWDEMTVDWGCGLVVMLVPANRTEQGWWQRRVEPLRDRPQPDMTTTLRVKFLPGRMRFRWPASRVVPPKGDRPPFGCALLIWERVP